MGFPILAKLAAAIWPDNTQTDKNDVRAWGLSVETALNAGFSNPVLINGGLAVSVAANVLTIAVKTLAGNDPSAADPVYAVFRHATAGNGAQAVIAITAATNLVVSAGSTLGTANATPFSLMVVVANDAGTFRLGIVNTWSAGVRYPLPAHGIVTSTAEGGAGGADSAGVIYTGTAVTAKAWRLLARLTWISSLATAGLWSAAPDVVKMWGPEDVPPGTLPQGYLYGLALSNNGSDASNDIDIAAGCAVADGDLGQMILTATLTKRSDAAWAVGSGNGGMDTGSKTGNQWLYLWLIERSDTGVVDALFSASATAPTMPAGYDKRRRIGAVLTDGGSNVIGFIQDGDDFWLKVPINKVSSTNPGTAQVLRPVVAPPLMRARFIYWVNNVSTAALQILILDPAQTVTAPTTTLFHLRGTATSQVIEGEFVRRTDSSSQVGIQHQASGASDAFVLTSLGWVDGRGRGAP